MRKYAIAVGTIKVVSDQPIPDELRRDMLKTLRKEFAARREELGLGLELVFDVVKT